ncbi:hypothetical protein ACIHCX_10825 [Streptomyces sp. NPDC052043]|uniref:hypothetical protein n=1 Tax=Streptomyces sp. NPDC052043 TaxID=3365684 RepID=UPI0037CE3AF3
MDNPTALKGPTPDAYEAACAALWAHRDRADALAAAFDSIRAWRHLQPHGDAVDFAPLDAILDAAAVGGDVPLQQLKRPATAAEAAEAHRVLMNARAQAFEAQRLVWDQIEAA